MTDYAVPSNLAAITSVDSVGVRTIAPRSVDEIVGLVRSLVDAGATALPMGSGSTFAGMHQPNADVRLASSGYAGIVDYQPDDLTVVVRAGTTLGQLFDELGAEGQTAVLPELERERTIGGVVASGASGYRRLRYGPTRDRVLGVTLVTGYGQAVSGGGALVKNVTGYDLPRLCTASHGTLGFIAEVCLKLWPVQPAFRTIEVENATEARAAAYKPLAVLETPDRVVVMVEGSEASVLQVERVLGGTSHIGLLWPDLPADEVGLSVRVPASSIDAAIAIVSDAGSAYFVAQHGIGLIDVGFDSLQAVELQELRTRVGEFGGLVVVSRWAGVDPMPDRWGVTPGDAGISDRLTALFDPEGVFRVGQLLGGL